MKNPSLPLSLPMAAVAALLALPVFNATALEMRTWLRIDGTQFEAELVRQVGDEIELRDKDGRPQKIPRNQLSFGDLDYVEENAPADKTTKSLGTPSVKPKLPNPAKTVKIDTKTFVKEAGLFKINSRSYKVCETPHFKIMYLKPADPMGIAELAERLWIDTAFFHSTFIPKWHDRKMGIVLVNDEEAFGDVGSWYADMLSAVGTPEAKEAAERTRKIWPTLGSGGVNMPQAQADAEKIFNTIRVFRTYRMLVSKDTNGNVVSTKKEQVKGVWVPFHTHTIAADLLGVQGGDIASATPEGSFALFTGHAYYKEIQLNQRSETVRAYTEGTGKDVGSAGGFSSGKGWADELRKLIKKGGEWKPDLDALMRTKSNDARVRDNVFAYAWAYFLQSTPERLSAFNKLCQKVDVANQVPDLEEVAAIYGYENAGALKNAWVAWMTSTEFK